MLRWYRLVTVVLASCLTFGLAGVREARAEEYVMKIATVAPDNTPWSELLKMYKKAVEEKSAGRIKVKVYLGGTLGDENETVLKAKRGQIQAVGASTGAVASQVPELNVIELPFLFRNYAEADHIIDTILTPELEKIFPEYGLVLGFWSENGYRQFGSRDGFIRKPSDLKGKKMRSQESEVHVEMWKSYGASPNKIPTTEVLTALQNGTVDGFDQALLYAIAASWHSTVKYFTISNHIYQPAVIAFNKEWFEGLPPDLQKILIDEGRAIQNKGRKGIRAIVPKLIEVLKSEGCQVYELTEGERSTFEAASAGVRKIIKKKFGKRAQALLEKVEAGLKAYR